MYKSLKARNKTMLTFQFTSALLSTWPSAVGQICWRRSPGTSLTWQIRWRRSPGTSLLCFMRELWQVKTSKEGLKGAKGRKKWWRRILWRREKVKGGDLGSWQEEEKQQQVRQTTSKIQWSGPPLISVQIIILSFGQFLVGRRGCFFLVLWQR